jgi:hypothetical protein
MRSATSVPNRWRVTVLLNRRRASGCGGASLFQTTTAGMLKGAASGGSIAVYGW